MTTNPRFRDWYHSAQEVRVREESVEQVEDDSLTSPSQVLEDVPEEVIDEDAKISKEDQASVGIPAHDSAANELYVHEILALLSCFVFPVLGAWLLHALRSVLSRPSEGLVSNFNITVFLFASEIRPIRHLVKLIQARTLRLQKIVNAHAYNTIARRSPSDVPNLKMRLEELEAAQQSATMSSVTASSTETQLTGKQVALVSTEVRRNLQPELDSLNRAVRRYEKRLATQTMQTEARILDLEARLADAITLAAAAAAQQNFKSRHGFGNVLAEWTTFAVVFPLQLATLPFRLMSSMISLVKHNIFGAPPTNPKKKVITNGRYSGYPRPGGERLQSKGLKR